jgi:hypothetical protein
MMASSADKIPVFKPLLESEELEAAKAALELERTLPVRLTQRLER